MSGGPGRVDRELESNAAALMVSSVATGVLGLVYWVIAERFFPTAEVGRASALVSTATMLASIACLSLGGSYQRFLPVAGRRTATAVLAGTAVVTVTALIIGTVFAAVGPGRHRMFTGAHDAALFPLIVASMALYALYDPILTGLRRARTVAVKNVSVSVLKIVPVVVLAGTGSALALAGSWALLALAVTAVIAVTATMRVRVERAAERSALPRPRELWAFQGVFFSMSLVLTLTPLALPLLVISAMDAEYSAYFNLAWTMCSAIGLLRSAVGASFVVEAARPEADRAGLLRRGVRMLAAVGLLGAVALTVGGPVVLYLVGSDYLHAAWLLMLVMAGESLVAVVPLMYFLLAQILRRLRWMFLVQCVGVGVTLAVAAVTLPRLGLAGVGIGVLAGQTVGAALVAVPLVGAIRAFVGGAGVVAAEASPTGPAGAVDAQPTAAPTTAS